MRSKHSSLDKLARMILRDTAERIDREIRQKQQGGKKFNVITFKNRHPSRWCPCRCLICDTSFGLMTNYHASTHGYESAEDMISDGKVRFL